jgi:hypothetical protein
MTPAANLDGAAPPAALDRFLYAFCGVFRVFYNEAGGTPWTLPAETSC